MKKLTLSNIWHHFRTIQTHRKWVRHYCFMAGIPWRGLKHDLSKYSPTEFFESARYYVGTSSPINEAKKDNGVSSAWQHHKGRNKHHYEYWVDKFDDGGYVHVMPQNDFIELVCDYLGAARAYTKSKFSYANENEWWQKKRNHCAMNEVNKKMLDIIFSDLASAEYYHTQSPALYVSPETLIRENYFKKIYRANLV